MNAVANDQPFTLMKHRRMCGVMVRPIGAPGNNDADWWLIGLHGPDLHWRSMRAKHLAFAIGVGWQVERVMLLTGGVFGRNIQRGKIIIVGFDIWAFGNLKPHFGKDSDHFFNGA